MFKKVLPISLIMGLRFFGLYLVMPLLAVYALALEGANPFLVGVAMGGFALSQIIFQVPFGHLSDKIGRKKSIFIGILVFIIGSVVCALATDIYTLIVGRLLQGVGAFGGVISAYVSDLSDEDNRPKAMAIMGAMIGMSFLLSMLVGPLLGAYIGVAELFYVAVALSLFSIYLLKVSPTPQVEHLCEDDEKGMWESMGHANLLIMYLTNFLQKGLMMLAFIIIPLGFVNYFSWEKSELWLFFAPAVLLSFLALPVAVIFAQKRKKYKEVLLAGVFLFVLSFSLMSIAKDDQTLFFVGGLLFFMAFNLHEPIVQSLTANLADKKKRGATLGLFNAFGFLGTFIGGALGALVFFDYGLTSLSLFVSIVSIFWTYFLAKMRLRAGVR